MTRLEIQVDLSEAARQNIVIGRWTRDAATKEERQLMDVLYKMADAHLHAVGDELEKNGVSVTWAKIAKPRAKKAKPRAKKAGAADVAATDEGGGVMGMARRIHVPVTFHGITLLDVHGQAAALRGLVKELDDDSAMTGFNWRTYLTRPAYEDDEPCPLADAWAEVARVCPANESEVAP